MRNCRGHLSVAAGRIYYETLCLFGNGGCRYAENAMRSLIAAVLSVAALLSVNSGAFAQGAQPQGAQPQITQPQGAQPQIAQPTPGPTSSSEYSYEEHGRYHPCPSSVRFNNRPACLGCPARCRWLPSDLTVH